MAFLDNSGDIILDAVLTDTGRLRLAQGDGSFKISKFALGDDEIIVEWSEEDWFKFTVAERAELEAQAVGGWSAWQIGPIDAPLIAEDEEIWEYLHTLDEEACDACGEDPCICNKEEADINAEKWLKEYKAKNTMQRRSMMRNKDRNKFKDKQKILN